MYTCFMLLFGNVIGQNKLSKELKETYPLSKNGALYINNKYGDVYVNGWDKDSIQIEVSIAVTGKKLDKVKDLLYRIAPNIIATNAQVIIKSEISEKKQSLFSLSRYINKIDLLNTDKANTSIDYIIYLPKSVEIEVFNKYGDVIISDWNGKLVAHTEHGDLMISDNTITNSKIALKYGKLRANTLYNTSINAKAASIAIEHSSQLKLESDGSDITIGVVDELELNSNKDNIEIDNLKNAFGDIKFSKVIFNTVSGKTNLNLNVAELRLKKLDNSMPIVNIQQKSSEVYINISKTNFNFSAELEQGVLRIPKTMNNISSKVIDKKNKIRQIRAVYGGDAKGIFDFTGYKGIIILKEL